MRYAVEFLLTLVYELSDQVRRTHSFIFHPRSRRCQHDPRRAAAARSGRPHPGGESAGYYSTDLGHSLHSFSKEHMRLIDSRTTILFFGDGRNNYNDPRLDITQEMQRQGPAADLVLP